MVWSVKIGVCFRGGGCNKVRRLDSQRTMFNTKLLFLKAMLHSVIHVFITAGDISVAERFVSEK
jgi:hypothetical protein